MKKLIILLILITSCSNDDDLVIPSISDENSFTCKIDNEIFVAKNHRGFYAGTGKPIMTTIFNNNLKIILGDGKTDIYLYLNDLNELGDYEIEEIEENSFYGDHNVSSASLRKNNGETFFSIINSGKIQVIEFERDEKLILKFDEIILQDSNNADNLIVLSDGMLNINYNTLND